MKISLTGSGALAGAYLKVNPSAEVFSFRKMEDDQIVKVIRSSDVIVHNSASLSDENDNFELTKRIVDLVGTFKPRIKFINIGSMSYLSGDGYLPIERMTRYAYSKFISEIYSLALLPNARSVRFSTIFYKSPQRDGLSKLIHASKMEKKITLINGGSARRDFIPLGIAARYLDYVIREETAQIINICSGIETSFYQVAKMILKYIDARLVFEKGEVPEVRSWFTRELPEIVFSLEEEIKYYICEP